RYTLTRTGDVFRGDAEFLMYIPDGQGTKREATHPVVVPSRLMEGVLEDLTAIRVSLGPYKAWIRWTDDYPHISLRVTFGDQEVKFFSDSQGPEQVPWGVEQNGQTVVAESEDIAITFRQLDACLLVDTYTQMIREIREEERRRGRWCRGPFVPVGR